MPGEGARPGATPRPRTLADDLRRFLDGEPILARPPSVTYRLAKFARRNKVLVAGVAAVFLALVAGLIGTGVGLARANAQRDRAEGPSATSAGH